LKKNIENVVKYPFQAILTGIEVEWIMHGFMNTKKQPDPPPSLITGEHMLSKLVLLTSFFLAFSKWI